MPSRAPVGLASSSLVVPSTSKTGQGNERSTTAVSQTSHVRSSADAEQTRTFTSTFHGFLGFAGSNGLDDVASWHRAILEPASGAEVQAEEDNPPNADARKTCCYSAPHPKRIRRLALNPDFPDGVFVMA